MISTTSDNQKLFSVYFSSIADYPKEALSLYNPRHRGDGLLNRFKHQFLDATDCESTYLFIISIDQIDSWEKTVSKYNLKDWIIFESDWHENANYPDKGRLKVYVLEKPL